MENQILIESGSRFQCVPDCGFCCGFWNIHIDQERKENLMRRPWVRDIARELEETKGKDLFKIIGQETVDVIQRQGGICSFINERQYCKIHALEGFEAKPIPCQQFPFIYYKTPRGIEVLLDFSCPEVIRNAGEHVTKNMIQDRLEREEIIDVKGNIPISNRLTLDWDGYQHLEAALLQIASIKAGLSEKILAMESLVIELDDQLGKFVSANKGELMNLLRNHEANQFQSHFSGVCPPDTTKSKRDLYVAIFNHLVEAAYWNELKPRRLSFLDMLQRIIRNWRGIGVATFEVFKITVDYRKAERVTFDLQDPSLEEILNRYLHYLVRRLMGTSTNPIKKRIAIMATNFAQVDWFAKAHAASQQREMASVEDLTYGIKIVEKFFGLSVFNKVAKRKDFLSRYINFLYENPGITRTMLAGKPLSLSH